jgi:hypothetical protein
MKLQRRWQLPAPTQRLERDGPSCTVVAAHAASAATDPRSLHPRSLSPSHPPPLQLTDEWAASVMPGSDVAGLRQQLLAAKRSEREAQQRERVADAFMAAVGQAVDCDIPDSLLAELGAQQYRCAAPREAEGQGDGAAGQGAQCMAAWLDTGAFKCSLPAPKCTHACPPAHLHPHARTSRPSAPGSVSPASAHACLLPCHPRSVTLNRLLSEGQLNYETVQQLATPEMVRRVLPVWLPRAAGPGGRLPPCMHAEPLRMHARACAPIPFSASRLPFPPCRTRRAHCALATGSAARAGPAVCVEPARGAAAAAASAAGDGGHCEARGAAAQRDRDRGGRLCQEQS